MTSKVGKKWKEDRKKKRINEKMNQNEEKNTLKSELNQNLSKFHIFCFEIEYFSSKMQINPESKSKFYS